MILIRFAVRWRGIWPSWMSTLVSLLIAIVVTTYADDLRPAAAVLPPLRGRCVGLFAQAAILKGRTRRKLTGVYVSPRFAGCGFSKCDERSGCPYRVA